MPALDDTKIRATPKMQMKPEQRLECILRRRRLSGVVELARIYANFGVKELADVVGRDKTRVIPPTGNPKLDMVDALAGVLEWTVKDVVNALRGGPPNKHAQHPQHATIQTRLLGRRRRFEDLRRISSRLEKSDRTSLCGTVSGMMYRHAHDGHERSIALQMIGRVQMQMGDPSGSLISFRNGLGQSGLDFTARLELKIDLCRAHMGLHHHIEARTIATDVLGMIADDTRRDRVGLDEAEASARYIRGNAVRESIERGVSIKELAVAREDLLRFLQLEKKSSNSSLDERTVAIGAILELDTELGTVTPTDAIHTIEATLRIASADLEEGLLKDVTRRAWSWWCLIGARIAGRDHGPGPRWEKTHDLARKAIMFSSRPEESLLRASAYLLWFRAWEGSRHTGARAIAWHMEPMELELFVKTMGAQNSFMEPGWRILRETGTLDRAKSMDPRTWRKGFVRA